MYEGRLLIFWKKQPNEMRLSFAMNFCEFSTYNWYDFSFTGRLSSSTFLVRDDIYQKMEEGMTVLCRWDGYCSCLYYRSELWPIGKKKRCVILTKRDIWSWIVPNSDSWQKVNEMFFAIYDNNKHYVTVTINAYH